MGIISEFSFNVFKLKFLLKICWISSLNLPLLNVGDMMTDKLKLYISTKVELSEISFDT